MQRQGSEGSQQVGVATIDTWAGARDLRWRCPTARGVRGVRLAKEDGRRCQVGNRALMDRVDDGEVLVNGYGLVAKKKIFVFLYLFFYEHRSWNKI
jgi:hypothetical protein